MLRLEATTAGTRSGRLPPNPSSEQETGLAEPPRDPVGQVFSRDGHPPIAVVDLGREWSTALRASWGDGRSPKSGAVIESAWLQSLFATGSTAASSLAAGHLFVATANPETLMVIGEGVGSAILSGGRIVGQAPFVAAGGSAILPVVAPLMLFTAVSSLITGARLDRIQRELGALAEVVSRMRHVMEAEAYGRFQQAATELDDIGSQFEHGQRFTDVMKMQLVQARAAMGVLRNQYGLLASRKIRSSVDARAAVSDINLFFLSSLMDLRADALHLVLTLQDNPGFAGKRQATLARRLDERRGRIRKLLEQDPIARFCQKLETRRSGRLVSRLRRRMPRRLGGGPPAPMKDAQKLRDDYRPVQERMERWAASFDSAIGAGYEASILVFRDDTGALCARHTPDLRLQRTAA